VFGKALPEIIKAPFIVGPGPLFVLFVSGLYITRDTFLDDVDGGPVHIYSVRELEVPVEGVLARMAFEFMKVAFLEFADKISDGFVLAEIKVGTVIENEAFFPYRAAEPPGLGFGFEYFVVFL
jgi:hypothetical protein